MTDKYKEHMDKVRKARVQLLGKHPFFADLAFGLPIEFSETLNPPTAATDGRRIIFHPEFVEKMPIGELTFTITHEVIHCALMHCLRRGNRCPKRWNIACDIVDNQMLREHGIGTFPEWVIYEPDLFHKGNGKVEHIYDLLPDTKEYGDPGSGGKNASMDQVLDADPATKEELAADWRNKLQQAVQTAKAAGNMPGGLEAFVDQLTTPKVNWKDKLRSFVMTSRGGDRTWAKRNRRHVSSGIMLPGNYGESMGVWVVAPDCSGSTSDQMIAQVGAEVRSIQEELRPEKIHVVYWDTSVKKHEEFEPDDPIEVKAYGRGGTDPTCLFEYLAKEGIEPEGVIVPTDLYFGGPQAFGPKPDYPVLWTVMESSQRDAPWGEVLVVD